MIYHIFHQHDSCTDTLIPMNLSKGNHYVTNDDAEYCKLSYCFFFFFFYHVANQTRIILLTTKRVNVKDSIEHACKSLLMYHGSGQEWINTAYNFSYIDSYCSLKHSLANKFETIFFLSKVLLFLMLCKCCRNKYVEFEARPRKYCKLTCSFDVSKDSVMYLKENSFDLF